MKSVLIICFNDLKNDARVTRQINFVKHDFKLTVLAFDAVTDSSFELRQVEKTKLTFIRKAVSSVFLLLGMNKIAYRLLYDYQQHVPALRNRKFDLIIANDIESLPLAFDIATPKTNVFFDAHEYAPRQFEDRLYWRIFFQRFTLALCKEYIPKVAGMSTINSGIANAYETHFGVKSIIITNASDYMPLTPIMRDVYPIRLVHHGIFTLSRSPHIMIDLMKLLDSRFTLDLIYMLPQHASPGTQKYFESFKKMASETGRIRILPALKGSDIIPFIHKHYDMGIILVPPVNFNYENGLPNKLFDCIQARIAMVVGPLREIAQVVTQHDIGIVSPDFTAEGMASVLTHLDLDHLNEFKKNANAAASKMNAEFNKAVLLEALHKIV
jgi:hypothetical protein